MQTVSSEHQLPFSTFALTVALKIFQDVLGKQRLADLCEFEPSLFYKLSSRTATSVTQGNFVSKEKYISWTIYISGPEKYWDRYLNKSNVT